MTAGAVAVTMRDRTEMRATTTWMIVIPLLAVAIAFAWIHHEGLVRLHRILAAVEKLWGPLAVPLIFPPRD
ncbi:MAG: hypothetical protein ACYDA0_06340 [Candidatus Dormibacteraceae bacterium]